MKTKINISKQILNFEKKIQKNLHRIFCPVHLSIGHEKVAEQIFLKIKKHDYLYSYHRNHHHYIAKGGSKKKLFDEILGKKKGLNKGYAGSQSICDESINFYASAIVGGLIGTAAGTAYALKKEKNNTKVVVCCFGDAGSEQGVFWESLNFSMLNKLPVIFICENNGMSVDANISERQYGSISNKVKGFGLKIFNDASKAIDYTRKFQKPSFCEIKLKLKCAHINMATMTELV